MGRLEAEFKGGRSRSVTEIASIVKLLRRSSIPTKEPGISITKIRHEISFDPGMTSYAGGASNGERGLKGSESLN
jgi:hypothetical protein